MPERAPQTLTRCLCIALVLLVMATTAPTALAQGSAAGIAGQVTDSSGATLPGVTVTVTSPALQVPQMTALTSETGEYRVSPLPIGSYTVTFELSGFQTVRRQEVRLTVGFTARIDARMSVGTMSETVTVSGAAPVVDVTGTTTTTTLTNEVLALTATPRNNIASLLPLAPGVRTFIDVGGGAMMLESPAPRVHGIGGFTWFTFDGVYARSADMSQSFDFNALEEVRMVTLGADAELPSIGLNITAVVKSGGDAFHGSGFGAFQNSRLQSDNVDAPLRALGIDSGDRLDSQYDLSADLGGRLIANKLWFYQSIRQRRAAINVLNTFLPDGSPGQNINKQRVSTSKLTYQATRSNKFTFLNVSEYGPEEKGLNELVRYESREVLVNRRHNTMVGWDGLRGTSFIGNLQFAYQRNDRENPYLNSPELVGATDLETGAIWGDNPNNGAQSPNRTFHTKGSVTWYKPTARSGNHELKSGFDYNVDTNMGGIRLKRPNYYLAYSDGVPDRVAFINGPVETRSVQDQLGVYVKDNWTLNRRTTLNLGLRYSRETQFAPEICREAAGFPSEISFPAQCFPRVQQPIWHRIVPRLQASYDVTGDGKTLLKGGYNRYNFRLVQNMFTSFVPTSTAYAVFAWRDLNRNNLWDLGESNRDPNGPDFIETTGAEFSGLPPKFVTNPDLKQVYFDEFSVNLERELVPNLSLRVTGIYTQTKNAQRFLNPLRPYEAYNVPVTNRDPGRDGVVGTADDGGLITYYEFSPSLAGAEFEEYMPVNDRRANSTYKTIEASASKRMANRWQLLASFSATKKNRAIGARNSASALSFGTASPTFSSAGDHAGFLNPNQELFTSDNTWDWDGKIVGTYILPFNLPVSVNYQHASGDPFAREVRFTGGRTIPAIVLPVETIGTYRRPSTNLVNLKLEKQFKLPHAQTATVSFNLYNALNANTATGLQNRSGASFLRPRSILPPRLAEFSFGYKF